MSDKTSSVWDSLTMTRDEEERIKQYLTFLTQGKTEREVWNLLKTNAAHKGFADFKEATDFTPGRKNWFDVRGKAGLLVIAGRRPLEEGFHLIGTHIDAPRLDLKPRPLYEEDGLAFFKTHYYGGVKKYQWTALPLALHGVIALKDGRLVNVVLGEDESDPVFTITDLLPHLGKDQREKKMTEGIRGEDLNLLLGHRPAKGVEEKRLEQAILTILNEKYGMSNDDFASAELEIVPAGKARFSGLDKSFVLGYGQDDRICAYAAWQALEQMEIPEWTCIALFVDKEETGSQSNTGAQAHYLEDAIAELITLQTGAYDGLKIRRALSKAKALSGDVAAGYDPTYSDAYDKRNAAFLGQGVTVTKYTGARGKSDTSEARAEYVAEMRQIFDNAGVLWQAEEMGKIDQGGGGTIAMYLAAYGMDVLDVGVSLLSMHSPWEVSSVADLTMLMRGYHAFFTAERKG